MKCDKQRSVYTSTADEYRCIRTHKTSRLQSFDGRMIQQGLYGGRISRDGVTQAQSL
nr:MAG TPA: hypothetical protein [Caudoviricetes sp.]